MFGLGRLVAGAPAAILLIASTAEAGLDICNETKDDITLAFGYHQDGEWSSTGWWNVEPGNCATVYEANLTERYYYYYAEQVNGNLVWEGDSDKDMFCAMDEAFTIVGDSDCSSRGYDSYRFRQLDVGKRMNWGIELTE